MLSASEVRLRRHTATKKLTNYVRSAVPISSDSSGPADMLPGTVPSALNEASASTPSVPSALALLDTAARQLASGWDQGHPGSPASSAWASPLSLYSLVQKISHLHSKLVQKVSHPHSKWSEPPRFLVLRGPRWLQLRVHLRHCLLLGNAPSREG